MNHLPQIDLQSLDLVRGGAGEPSSPVIGGNYPQPTPSLTQSPVGMRSTLGFGSGSAPNGHGGGGATIRPGQQPRPKLAL